MHMQALQVADENRKLVLYKGLINASLDAMMVIDREGKIIDLNQAAEGLIGIPYSDLVGSCLTNYFTEQDCAEQLHRQVFQGNKVQDVSLTVKHAQGRQTQVLCNAMPHSDGERINGAAFVVARDISELKQYEIQLIFQATCDPLTALFNRRHFAQLLEQAIERAAQHKNNVVVALIDVDDFKDINDAFGYIIGDELLQMIARRLSDCVGTSATLARSGGDEFVVFIENADNDCLSFIRNIQSIFQQGYVIESQELFVSSSIGVTLFPFDADNVADLLRNADMAMYWAKAEGKGAYQRYTPEINSGTQRRLHIGHRLRHAQQQSEFTLHYQPKIELRQGTVVGVEALLRWRSNGENISPAEFIPIAEQNGMIIPIGEWVLNQACRQAKRWLDEEGIPLLVAVNLSARQFRGFDVVELVRRILQESGLPSHLLELELTEGMVMHDSAALPTLGALKKLGVTLSIDDFGTGYSSLSYLKRFPIDYLKIDRSFVTDVTDNPNDAAIVTAIIGMAHSLGLKVIAEGVETAEQLAFLVENSCDEIQGYYFSKPLPENELGLLLREGRRMAL